MPPDDTNVIGFISRNEFDEGCWALKQLSLSSRQTAARMEIREEGNSRYLTISRQLLEGYKPQQPTMPTSQGPNKPTTNIPPECLEVEDGEDDEEDEAAIHHGPPTHASAIMGHDIIYSDSYRVPVLYFLLHNLPPVKSRSIDSVYELLVPGHLHASAKAVGVMGGIGMTNHPFTDMPCFWVHPCNTARAMCDILGGIKGETTPLEYLVIWTGLVGVTVGLSLPKDMIIKMRESPLA